MSFLLSTAAVIYLLAMGLVFGGTAALSFATAPQVFRTLEPVDAGKVFGKVLRVFDGMAWFASAAAVLAAVLGIFVTISGTTIAMLALATLTNLVLTILRRSVAPRMAALKPPETKEEERTWDPEKRREFDALHAQYVRLYATNLFLSAAALVIAAIR